MPSNRRWSCLRLVIAALTVGALLFLVATACIHYLVASSPRAPLTSGSWRGPRPGLPRPHPTGRPVAPLAVDDGGASGVDAARRRREGSDALAAARDALAGATPSSGSADAYVRAYVDRKRRALRALRELRRLTVELRAAIGASDISAPGFDRMPIPDAPHEDDAVLPEPTTQNCQMAGDGFDVCTYENVCVELPGPFAQERWDKPPWLLLVRADPGGGGGGGVGGGGVVKGDAGADDSRAKRHERRDRPRPDVGRTWNVSGLIPPPEIPDAFDTVYVDVADTRVGFAPRPLPWAMRLSTRFISPSDTVSIAHGGSFNGTVTWVDNLWMTKSMLGAHLWGFGSTTLFPIFGAWLANKTMGLDLPPLDNLLIMNTEADRANRFHLPSAFEWADGAEVTWAVGFLTALLRHVRSAQLRGAPVLPPFHGKVPPGRGGRFPLLDALLARAAADAGVAAPPTDAAAGGANASGAAAAAATPPYDGDDGRYDALAAALARAYGPDGGPGGAPRPLPVDFLRMENTLPGTRVIWSMADVPVPPTPYAAPGGGPPLVETRRRRLCTRRGVLLGERPTLVTGAVEANAIREFGHRALGVERLEPNLYGPSQRVLLLDRGKVYHGPIKPRGFSNLGEMVGVLEKYNLTFDLVTDRNLSRLTFEGQAQLFGRYGLVVVAHGAGETNFAFLPRRAAVIEISPVMLWCPLYHRFLSALGHSVFPIFSRLKGPLLEWNVILGEEATMEQRVALADSCERKPLTNVARMHCWHEARNAAVTTPIHEFEHVLLRALDTIGIKKFPLNSSIDMLEGLAQGGPDVPFWSEGHYEAARWRVCPPGGAHERGGSGSS